MTLSLREQRFVAEYPVVMSASAAAIRAGYSPKTAHKYAYKLMRRPEIAAAIAALEEPVLARAAVTLERLVQEAAHIAFADMRKALRPDGTLKPLEEIDAATGAALHIEAAQASDGRSYLKVRSHSKVAAMFLLARHLMLAQGGGGSGNGNVGGVEASAGDGFADAMAEARERYA